MSLNQHQPLRHNLKGLQVSLVLGIKTFHADGRLERTLRRKRHGFVSTNSHTIDFQLLPANGTLEERWVGGEQIRVFAPLALPWEEDALHCRCFASQGYCSSHHNPLCKLAPSRRAGCTLALTPPGLGVVTDSPLLLAPGSRLCTLPHPFITPSN